MHHHIAYGSPHGLAKDLISVFATRHSPWDRAVAESRELLRRTDDLVRGPEGEAARRR
jgi:hypothetical protein